MVQFVVSYPDSEPAEAKSCFTNCMTNSPRFRREDPSSHTLFPHLKPALHTENPLVCCKGPLVAVASRGIHLKWPLKLAAPNTPEQ